MAVIQRRPTGIGGRRRRSRRQQFVYGQTPPERTIYVGAENRMLQIEAEDRTVFIGADNRMLQIEAEDRTVFIGAENRTIRVE